MKKAITLLSGGLDSYISTRIAKEKYRIVLALTFDYGQLAARKEILASGKICRNFGIHHKVIKLPWLSEITETALVNRKVVIPDIDIKRTTARELKKTAEAVWVPNRNGIFINIAAAFAEKYEADFIITGFNREEAKTFPDNSASFVSSIDRSLAYSTLVKPKVISFVQNMTKLDMIRYASKNKLDLTNLWSCYRGGRRPCGRCESCRRFIYAMQNVG